MGSSVHPLFQAFTSREIAMVEVAFGSEIERGLLEIEYSSEEAICLITPGGYPLVILGIDGGAFEAFLGDDDDEDPPFARGTLGDVLRALEEPVAEWVARQPTMRPSERTTADPDGR
jgi:hypothetical protein